MNNNQTTNPDKPRREHGQPRALSHTVEFKMHVMRLLFAVTIYIGLSRHLHATRFGPRSTMSDSSKVESKVLASIGLVSAPEIHEKVKVVSGAV